MTPEQYERWKDFSVRMAKTAFRRNRRPSSHDIIGMVEDFFASIEGYGFEYDPESICCIRSWDHSDPYPEGHAYRRIERQYICGCCYPNGYGAGTQPATNDCPHCHGTGQCDAYAAPMCVSDFVTESFYESWIPDYWGLDEDHYEQARDQWAGPPECCIRAGLDCAASPSMGVVGFTAGDIRRMYPDGVPEWVKGDGSWDTVPIKGVVPGVGFVPGDPVPNGTFDEIPDDAQIWI